VNPQVQVLSTNPKFTSNNFILGWGSSLSVAEGTGRTAGKEKPPKHEDLKVLFTSKETF
jgi:hypothetical protein